MSAQTHANASHSPLPDYFFVRRPVLAMVISILMVIVGLITLRGLAIEQYPSVVPPQIQVQTFFPGASAEVVEQSVASPIEQMINGVDDLLYIRSISGNDGSYSASVYFETGSDQDISNMLVQNRVQQATASLPQQVIQYGVTVRKAQSNILMLVSLYSPKGTYDQTFLANYVTLNVLDPMLRVKGVGDARLLSQSSYTMRLWLRPDRMAQLGLDATDVAYRPANPERADPRRPDRRAAAGLAARIPVPGPGAGLPADRGGIRQRHPALQPGRIADPGAGRRPHRARRAVVQHQHAHERHAGRVPRRVPGHRRRRAAHWRTRSAP